MKTTSYRFEINTNYVLLLVLCFLILCALTGCVTINPGEIGLKVKRGKLSPDNYYAGRHPEGPKTNYIRFSTRVRQISITASLPTKEGLEAKTDLILLYHIQPDSIRSIYLKLGMNYEKEIIMSNFSAISREVCLNFRAMELLMERDSLERSIYRNMKIDLSHYGFVFDQVLVKEIDVPDEIDKAIEKKVLSEQLIKQQEVDIITQKKATDASIEKQRKEMEFSLEKQKREQETEIVQERMKIDFAIEKQKKEAERSIIEAQAEKKVQDLNNSTITPMLIKYKTVEVMKALANSPNTKLIITDGKTPLTLLRESGQ